MFGKIFRTTDRIVVWIMRFVLVTAVIFTTCTMALQVLLRYVLEVPVAGLDELAGHTAVWLYMIGAAYGAWDRSHIKASILHIIVRNENILRLINTFASFITIIIAGFMVHWSYGYLEWSIRKHEITPSLQIPTLYFQIPIFISAVLMMIYFFVEMWSRFYPFEAAEDYYQDPVDN